MIVFLMMYGFNGPCCVPNKTHVGDCKCKHNSKIYKIVNLGPKNQTTKNVQLQTVGIKGSFSWAIPRYHGTEIIFFAYIGKYNWRNCKSV